ncbi:MAG: undecaprenyldiphospho-muramoylpentapeptide beta-N-acetylglucosaminyltransferase [Oscillospiraceae bacterium]|nr:undecaprenyldiphospho-muramoylpentapeptide beta-N-acetylglucosaminyltransferase [Oscillospiraceae bacterium]
MRFILTCGGSGGHINPALAVARLLRGRGHETLFIGAKAGMERDLVPREGFDIELLDVRPLSHSLSPKAAIRNVKALVTAAGAVGKAKKILKAFKPDAVLGTGGYAGFPALRAASALNIRALVHESNAHPGVTTRAAAKRADAILVGMESCRAAYKRQDRVHVTGTPVRPEFFTADRLKAREALRLDNRPVIVSLFGSQGARDMNRMVLELMKLEDGDWQHIHAAGPKRYDALSKEAAERGLVFDGATGLRMLDYISNMAEVMAAADLVVCRAGASTLAELAAAGKPAVLIPSPNVTADHQTANARMLEAAGGAAVLPEAGLTAETLYRAVKDLLKDTAKRGQMSAALKKLAVADSAERIADMMTAG